MEQELRTITDKLTVIGKNLPLVLILHREIWKLAIRSLRSYEIESWAKRVDQSPAPAQPSPGPTIAVSKSESGT